MRTIIRYRIPFNASHTVEGAGLCGGFLHGHDWYAEILVEAKGPPDTVSHTAFLASMAAEIDHRDLNDMLPGVEPTAAGVAGWFLERARMHVPGLLSITVGFTDHAVTVEV